MGADPAAGVCPDRVLSRRGGDNGFVVGETAGGRISVVNAKLSPRSVAISINRGLGHAQLAGDLFGAQMAIDKPQAFPLSGSQELDCTVDCIPRLAYNAFRLPSRAQGRLPATVALMTLALDF